MTLKAIRHQILHRILLVAFLLVSVVLMYQSVAEAQANGPDKALSSGSFATLVTASIIDDHASAEWVDGVERPVANPSLLRQQLWTQSGASAPGLFAYGASPHAGTRRLRIGFTSPIPVGSILLRGDGSLSVLSPTASYPGNLADDSQWIPARRIMNRAASTAEEGTNSFALWVLPAGTRTRALRFTHVSAQTDANYAGVLGGAYVLSNRYANLAPQAVVTTSANQAGALMLVDEKSNDWLAWDNGPEFLHAVTTATPEWIMLTWPKPVSLAGLAALWAGFNGADVQVFTGAESIRPELAANADWRPIGRPYVLHNQYPRSLGIDWMDFGSTVQTRAVRLRMTAVTDESHHPHLGGKTKGGNRVWLGELMALSPLQSASLGTAILPASAAPTSNPPIPIRFTLDSPGYVTLVIEDDKGNRVRNLISNTWFEAGPNTVWWDGTDDLLRSPDAAAHGVYLIPTEFVSPGSYTVRGLYHKAIDLHYEFSVYNSGHPAWDTADTKGGWLTNHTPPSSTLFVPPDKAPGGNALVYIGSYVSEGGAGLAWVDLDGTKQGGRGSIGAAYNGAPYLARDTGSHANPDAYAYVGVAWFENKSDDDKQQVGVVRLTALTARGDKSVLHYQYDLDGKVDVNQFGGPNWFTQIGGLAVHDNLAIVSQPRQDRLLLADLVAAKVIGTVPLDHPDGLAFDSQGHLLVLSGRRLLRYSLTGDATRTSPPKLDHVETVIDNLEDPAGLTLDNQGNIYISDRGNSNQVKVYTVSGKMLRAIGSPGPPRTGAYDPLHMNNPRGIGIDSNNHLWVAEEDYLPKRVSVWTLDGKFIKGFYGPALYGGGGTIDPKDKTRFYYGGMEFKLDWTSGTDTLAAVLYRGEKEVVSTSQYPMPDNVIYDKGHRYFTNAYMSQGATGVTVAFLYLETNGGCRRVAALGQARDWAVLKGDAFKSGWPKGVDLFSKGTNNSALFAWSDTNNDGKVEPEEVTYLKTDPNIITTGPNLSFISSFVDGKAVMYTPVSVTAGGIPIYDLQKGTTIIDGVQRRRDDGGGQVIYSPEAIVSTTAPLPFAPQSLGGVDSHGHRWSYPSLWPGVHPSHAAPVATVPGELLGTTRLLGGFVTLSGGDSGKLWAINGNLGDIYLFTSDGLFVSTLFQDVRTGKPWTMPAATRNMLLNDISLHDENFFPSLNQTADGKIYIVDGTRTSIVRVDGLETIRRIPASKIAVTSAQLDQARSYINQAEASRQEKLGPKNLNVTIRSGPPPLLNELNATMKSDDWATVDRRINQVGWNGLPDLVEAAITISGGRLFAAFRTHDPKLLVNSGQVPNAPFKTGGALDLMIGADPHANPERKTPVAGDTRLLVYQVGGKTKAMLYRAVKPGITAQVPFSSPDRTIYFAEVTDASNLVELYAGTGDAAGTYAFSIPLDTLGLKPGVGESIKADIGILRGNGTQTIQRAYWSNKATGITADVPSEAELTPNLWGQWRFMLNAKPN